MSDFSIRPKVSICMPTYNFERYLPEAIESVLSQNYENFEFIIVDDCSQDHSAKLIEKYAEKDKRIRVWFNDRNAGMVNNWNLCLAYARGEYIKFLFGDDKLASRDAVGRMTELLDANQEAVLVASARSVINEKSDLLEIVSFYKGGKTYRGSDIIRDCLLWHKNKIGEPSAVMFRKKHAGSGFDPRYRQIVDMDMWFRILEQGAFAYIDEPLVSFRMHPEQQTVYNTKNFMTIIDEPFLLLQDYSRKPYLSLTTMEKTYMEYLPVYSIWNLYKKHGKITRQTAIDLIKSKYEFRKFILLYPWFKIFKNYMSVVCKNGHFKW